MGPLVPNIISDEFNFIIAIILGILFGFILEQAGFSSTKKLVGLFYGYDFTVLKVFFTAGVTALTGVIFLTHTGLLDMNMVYINPTFLWSAIVGGLIMGAGFIIGGFCPGTSLCAAAVGKVDAWSFIGGSLIGILLFTEGYPYLEKLYFAENMGFVTIHKMLNMPMELFAVIMAVVAITAFYFTGMIEDRINGLKISVPVHQRYRYGVLAFSPLIILTLVSFTPDKNTFLIQKMEKQLGNPQNFRFYPMDKLAPELIQDYHKINLIDVRSINDYKTSTIPTAINIPLDSMLDYGYGDIFNQKYKINIFFGQDHEDAKKACLLASLIGGAENYVLDMTQEEFQKKYFEPEIPALDASKKEKDLFRYRINRGQKLKILEERMKNMKEPVKKEGKRVQGGCT